MRAEGATARIKGDNDRAGSVRPPEPSLISRSVNARDDQVCGVSEDPGGTAEATFLRTAFLTTALRTAFLTTALRTAFLATALRTAFLATAFLTASS